VGGYLPPSPCKFSIELVEQNDIMRTKRTDTSLNDVIYEYINFDVTTISNRQGQGGAASLVLTMRGAK